MRNSHFIGNSRLVSHVTPRIAEPTGGSGATNPATGSGHLTLRPWASTAVSATRKIMDWSMMTFVLLAMGTSVSIQRVQANKSAQDIAELTKASDAALQAIAEERKPDSPEKTERLKRLNKEIGEEIARLHRKYA